MCNESIKKLTLSLSETTGKKNQQFSLSDQNNVSTLKKYFFLVFF